MATSLTRAAPKVFNRIVVTRHTPSILRLIDGKVVDQHTSKLAGLSPVNGAVRPISHLTTADMLSYVAKGSFPGLPAKHQYPEPLTSNQELRQFIWCLNEDKRVFRIDSYTIRDSGQMNRADGLRYIRVRVDTTSPHGILDVLDQPSGVRVDEHPALLEDLSDVTTFEIGNVVGRNWFVAGIEGNIVNIERVAAPAA